MKWSAILGVGCAGIATGALTFVSFVDVRSFLNHISDNNKNKKKNDSITGGKEKEEEEQKERKQKGIELIQTHFPIWWPNGRDLMITVILSSLTTNLYAFSQTKDKRFIITATCVGFLGPYTGLILGEDIENLRQSQPKEVERTTRRFCNLHHVRLLSAAIGFGVGLTALADL